MDYLSEKRFKKFLNAKASRPIMCVIILINKNVSSRAKPRNFIKTCDSRQIQSQTLNTTTTTYAHIFMQAGKIEKEGKKERAEGRSAR